MIRHARGGKEDKIVFEGPGWISGRLVGVTIGGLELRTAAASNAPVIAKLTGETKDGSGYGPDSFGLRRVHGCQEHFVEVTIVPPREAGAKRSPLRGWVSKVCSNQLTTCDPSFTEFWIDEADAPKSCLDAIADTPDGQTCKVTAFGTIGTVAGRTFAYALYRYDAKGGPTMNTRAIVFERMTDGNLHVLFAPDSDGGQFGTPKLLKTRMGLLLHVPGWDRGAGNFNRERLFVWRKAYWVEVDTLSWLKTLQRRLPKGLEVRKGIYPDYTTMTASSPLWRKGDADACAGGGHAEIALAWSRNRIALAGVKVLRNGNACGAQ